ncbi:helix-turn-helix domain-containing protein [Nocardia nova]|uniref:helix-turn-helix domain-containing protein n=1 Tax=Nocardia nova TaxID=37330 RepID=UPI0037225B85
MGRKRNRLEPDGGLLTEFAYRLGECLDASGLSLREIARISKYSHSTIAAAVSGKRLPTWQVTEALLKACGEDDHVDQWSDFWQEARLVSERYPAELVEQAVGRGLSRRPEVKEPARTPYTAWRPRPDLVTNFAELADELQRFKTAIGDPSLEVLRAAMAQTGHVHSRTTICDVLAGRRCPKMELYRPLIRVMLMKSNAIHNDRKEAKLAWKQEFAWLTAWSRANHQRKQHRGGHTVKRSEAVSGVHPRDQISLPPNARKNPHAVADLLAKVQPAAASDIVAALPPRELRDILTAVFERNYQG